MADLPTTIAEHRQVVDTFLVTARAVPVARWGEPPAPGKWSPGQVAEHVTLAYEANRGLLHGRVPGRAAPRLLRPLIRTFLLNPVLRRGRFLPGSKSPKPFRPSAAPATQEILLARLLTAAAELETDLEAAAAAGETALSHPFFGRLPFVDFLRLQVIHTRHHRAQLTQTAA